MFLISKHNRIHMTHAGGSDSYICLYIYMGHLQRKLYRVPCAPKRTRKPMKRRYIRLNFYLNLLLNYLPPQFFFLESPRPKKFWIMPSEGQKTCFFVIFSKK